MKKLLALLVVIPITAVLTAGATVAALGVMWPERVPLRRSAPTGFAPAPETAVPAEAGPSAPVVIPPATGNAIELIAARGAADDTTESEMGADQLDATAAPAVMSSTLPVVPTDLRIDYVRLSDDIRQVSDVLERFNRKLTSRLAGTRGEAPADGTPAVALDDDERTR